jgi:hypothetical protein
MELFIRIKDGAPIDHPIMGENFRQAFPDVDTENLPAEFARFVRVQAPALGPYEYNQSVSYQLVDGVYTDVFTCEQMTAEEISAKQQVVKDFWVSNNGFASWTFNEQTCMYEALTPKPTDGKVYLWNEEQLAWVEVL